MTVPNEETESGVTIVASISDGSYRNAGGETTITAASYDAAVDRAVEWVREGDYAADTAQVDLVLADPNGAILERRTVTVPDADAADAEADEPALYDYGTGEYLRRATEDEADRSRKATEWGQSGAIEVDGRTCYVAD